MTRITTPLAWPAGRPRIPLGLRLPSPYGPVENGRRRPWTWEEAYAQVDSQMTALKAESWGVSIDMAVGRKVMESVHAHEPVDPGAVVTFQIDGKVYLLACDRWKRVEDNLHACALYIEWQRRIEKCGAGTIKQALQGHATLLEAPAPRSGNEKMIADVPRPGTPDSRNTKLLGNAVYIGVILLMLALGTCASTPDLGQPAATQGVDFPFRNAVDVTKNPVSTRWHIGRSANKRTNLGYPKFLDLA